MTGDKVDVYRECRAEACGRAGPEHRRLPEVTVGTGGVCAEVLKLGTEGLDLATCGAKQSDSLLATGCRGLGTIRLLTESS